MATHWLFLLIELFFIWETIDGYYNERRSQCLYTANDFSDMVFIDSYIFNKIQWIWFNSTVGKFQGYTLQGINAANYWNKDKTFVESERAIVQSCKRNAHKYYSAIADKTVEPQVKVRSVKQSDGPHPAMLICTAYNFYPKFINVTWLRNGQKIKGGVTSTEKMANGDWYYQVHSHLQYMPESGEEISCVVEHSSLKKPMIYKWDPSMPESDKSKIAIGASGLVLGIIISATGFIYYKKKHSGRILVPT